jgi:hypothetical protein
VVITCNNELVSFWTFIAWSHLYDLQLSLHPGS